MLGLVAAAAVAGWVGGRHALVEARANSGLVVEPARLDFGSVWASKGFTWSLPIHNPTEQLIKVVDLRSSCSCTSISPRELSIPAGATKQVQLTLDLTPAAGEQASSRSNRFYVLVTPHVAGGLAQEVGWAVRGEVLNPFDCEPRSPLGIDDLIFGQRPPAAAIKLHAFRDFERVEAECDPALGEVRINTASGREHELTFQPATEPPLGPFEARLRVRAVERSAQPPVEIDYVLHGSVLHPVEALPAGLTLGAVPVGDTIEEMVTLLPRLGHSLGTVAVERAPEGAIVELAESSAERAVVSVRQRIAVAGARIEPIRLAVQTIDGKSLPALEVNVAYVGTQRGDLAEGPESRAAADAAGTPDTNTTAGVDQ